MIRINSQSGKGGIGYLLEHKYGINMPKPMREEFGYIIKGISDHQHKELFPEEVHQIFMDTYLNLQTPIRLDDFYFVHKKEYHTTVSLTVGKEEMELTGRGNGRFDAVSNTCVVDLISAFMILSTRSMRWNVAPLPEQSLMSASPRTARKPTGAAVFTPILSPLLSLLSLAQSTAC